MTTYEIEFTDEQDAALVAQHGAKVGEYLQGQAGSWADQHVRAAKAKAYAAVDLPTTLVGILDADQEAMVLADASAKKAVKDAAEKKAREDAAAAKEAARIAAEEAAALAAAEAAEENP